MANEFPQIRVVQVLGLTSAALVAGAALSTSYIAIPSFQLAPAAVSVQQWKTTYDRGKATVPPIAALITSSFTYLAYTSSKSSLLDTFRSKLYASAAAAIFCMIPYTLLRMEGANAVNGKLIAKLDPSGGLDVTGKVPEAGVPKGETVRELLDSWASYNAVRALFPLTAAVLGLWAAVA